MRTPAANKSGEQERRGGRKRNGGALHTGRAKEWTAKTVRSEESHGVCYGHSGPSGRYRADNALICIGRRISARQRDVNELHA